MTGRRIFYLVLSALVLAGVIFALFAIAQTESADACHKRSHRCYAAWPTNTPTRTPTPFQPPLSTPAPPTATNTPTASPVPPTVTLTTVVPPALPSPPPGVYPMHVRYIVPRGYEPGYDRAKAIALYRDIVEGRRYYYARETGYTFWFDFEVVYSDRNLAELQAYPYPATGANTEAFCGTKNPAKFDPLQYREPYCGYTPGVNGDGCTPYAKAQAATFNFAPYDDWSQPGIQFVSNYPPDPYGAGLTETYVWESSAFKTLPAREDGLPVTGGNGRLRIDMAFVEGAGGWAGGATDIVRNADGSLRSYYGRSLVGDWGIGYAVNLDTMGFVIPPLSEEQTIPQDVVPAMDPCAWSLMHDISSRCGGCDDDARIAVGHELGHSNGFDTHAPVNIGAPWVHMADVQKIAFVFNAKPWLYEVPAWLQGQIAIVSGNPP